LAEPIGFEKSKDFSTLRIEEEYDKARSPRDSCVRFASHHLTIKQSSRHEMQKAFGNAYPCTGLVDCTAVSPGTKGSLQHVQSIWHREQCIHISLG